MLHLESDIGSGAGGFPLTISGVVGEGDGLAGCRASLQIMGNPDVSAILLDVFISLDGHVNSVRAVRIFGGRGDTANVACRQIIRFCGMRAGFVDALYLYSTFNGIAEILNDLIAIGCIGHVGFGGRRSMGDIDDNRESLGVIRPLLVSSAVESKRFLCVLILSQIMCTIIAGQHRIIGVKIRPRIKGHYAHPGKFINREQGVCPIIIDNITERVSFCHRTVIKISRCIMSRIVNALKRDFVCEI